MLCVAALYAASRILVAICRERLLPPAIAWVWERTLTPVWCTLITGVICGAPPSRAVADSTRICMCTLCDTSRWCDNRDLLLAFIGALMRFAASAAIIALLTDFVTLADLVSLGTLAVFLLVACALVYRRCYCRL